jgi:lysophospholipase L1-like esterase
MKTLSILFCGFMLLSGLNYTVLGQEKHKPTLEELDAWRKSQEERIHNDWADLNRFRADNEKIGLPAAGEKRVVFMGNSITIGWIEKHPEFFSGKPWINRGISGQTTPQMLVRFRADVINLNPSAVILLAGINDIAGNTGPSTPEMIHDNIAGMVEMAQAHNIKVILCSVLPAYDFPWSPGLQPAEKVVELNKWIRDYAASHHCLYIDYFTPMADDKNALKEAYTYDGVHPNTTGYAVMEPLAEKAIKQALGE